MNAHETLERRLLGYTLPAQFAPVAEQVDEACREGRVQVDLVALELVGVSLLRVALVSPRLARVTADELKKLSTDLCARVRYLLEPVGPLEIDAEQCVVQMRSQPPRQEPSGPSYYELLARRGGEIELCRYHKERGQVRQRLPFQLTREVLLRLVDDFAAVIEQA